MCCGCPGPQGGAHSTDTGPAHEPAAGSLPAAENTQHRVQMPSSMYPICAEQTFVVIAFTSHTNRVHNEHSYLLFNSITEIVAFKTHNEKL